MPLYQPSTSNFTDLLDGPGSFSGYGLYYIRVNIAETGLEYSTPSAGSGNVTGPATSTVHAIPAFGIADGTTLLNTGVLIDASDNVTGMTTLTLPNTGLHILDTNATHDLIISPGSNLTADRTLSLVTGDANRTVTLGGDLSLSKGFSTAGGSAYDLTLRLTGDTDVTLPTTGTLVTAATSLSAFAVPAADINMNSHKITNVTDPVSSQDAATKAYADAVASGLFLKAACRLASTANVGGTYVGSPTFTLTEVGFGALSIDGVTPSVGDRILLKDQTDPTQNGIWTVTVVGSGGASYVLTRATDFDSSGEILTGAFTFVTAGTANTAAGFVLITPATITLDTTSLTFTQFSAAGGYTAGNGLQLSGSSFSAVASTGIIVNGSGIAVDLSVVQPIDAGLTALAAFNTNGFLVQTANNTFAGRTISAASGVAVTNGDGVSGNPTIGADITSLTEDLTPDPASDYMMTYDTSAAAYKKSLLRNAFGGQVLRQTGTSPLECLYSVADTSATFSNSTYSTNPVASTQTLRAVPWVPRSSGVIDQLSIFVASPAVGGKVRMGLYSYTGSGNMYPDALVQDFGEVDVSSVGKKTFTISPQSIQSGAVYWFGWIPTTTLGAAISVKGVSSSSLFNLLGTNSAIGINPGSELSIAGQTYGALPSTFPSGASVSSSTAVLTPFMRFSS